MKSTLLALLIFAFIPISLNASDFPIQFKKHGPNCYNSALVYAGVMNHFRFVSQSEMDLLLNSPLCEPVAAKDAQFGDVRVYYRSIPELSETHRLIHANIYLTESKSLNKMTLYLTSPIQVEDQEKTDEAFGKTSPTLFFQTSSGKSINCQGSECINEKKFFRCSSLKDALIGPHLGSKAHQVFQSYQALSQELAQNAFVFTDPSALQSNFQNFANQVDRYCRHERSGDTSKDFPCRYYSEALHSIQTQITMKQPAQKWLDDYFSKSEAPSRLKEILSQDRFINRFFNVCGTQTVSYLTLNISNRQPLLVAQDLSTHQELKIPLNNLADLKSIEFSGDCSQLDVTSKKAKRTSIPLPFSKKSEERSTTPSPLEVKIKSSALGENKLGIVRDGRILFPFEKMVGRFQVLKSTTEGVFFHHENLLESSLYYYSLSKNSLETIRRFKPKANASILRVPLEVGKSHSLPSYVVQTKASKGIVLTLHGGGCWESRSHVEAYRFSPEALDIALAGYDLFLMSYSGDSDGLSKIPPVTNCGVDEILDVVQAVSFLKFKMGYENIFILGESYGAYLLNLLIGRFPNIPINGAVSKFGVWDLARQNAMIQSPSFLNIVPTEINDPKNFIKDIQTPVLLLHGVYDAQVAVSNATFFKEEAEKHSLNVETYILKHGISHGFDYGGIADLSVKLEWHNALLRFLKTHSK